MATWQEVKDFIRSNYVVSSEEGSLMVLQFETDRGRSQLIFVGGIENASELSSVRFFSPFARVDQISPAQFAQLASGSVFGLAESAGMYGFVHNSFLADLDASEINVPMVAVTMNADQVERQLGLGDSL